MAAKYRLSEKARRTSDPPITWLVRQAVSNPGVISLAAGLVDQQTLPTEDVRQILGELLANPIAGRAALQYGTADGHDVLRKRLLDRFCRAENVEPGTLALSADDVIVTTGCQQLLMLLADVLLDPGDIVFVGDPAYFVFMSLLQSVDARPRGVPLDGDGMRIDALEAGLEAAERAGELDRVKAVYVASYYENPTGLSLNAARRRQLFDLVGRYSIERQILIIEDAAYRELRYEGDDVPSIKSLDARNEVVVHCGTFSKPFSPGLRTGWGIVPPEVMTALRRQKANHDFGSANFDQHILAAALVGERFDRHVARLRESYRRKRDVMLDAMKRHLPPEAAYLVPKGGLYFWVNLPEGMDAGPGSRLFEAAFERGMIYVPGEFCYCPEPGVPKPRNCLRLSFGCVGEQQIREGVRRLGEAIRSVLA